MELVKPLMTPPTKSDANGHSDDAQGQNDAYPRVIGNNAKAPHIEVPMANYVSYTFATAPD